MRVCGWPRSSAITPTSGSRHHSSSRSRLHRRHRRISRPSWSHPTPRVAIRSNLRRKHPLGRLVLCLGGLRPERACRVPKASESLARGEQYPTSSPSGRSSSSVWHWAWPFKSLAGGPFRSLVDPRSKTRRQQMIGAPISIRAMPDASLDAPKRPLRRLAESLSALSVAPLAYLTRPQSANQILCGQPQCGDSSCACTDKCCDGWSTFCCQMGGGDNFGCPPYAYIGGWWSCSYTGTGLCSPTNKRYYVDCNRTPGQSCPNGCKCRANDCGNRVTCCISFRWGQCNTQITQTTEVVCRLVTCRLPCNIDCLNCSDCTDPTENSCDQGASCLS
jgi:hypothetical protein